MSNKRSDLTSSRVRSSNVASRWSHWQPFHLKARRLRSKQFIGPKGKEATLPKLTVVGIMIVRVSWHALVILAVVGGSPSCHAFAHLPLNGSPRNSVTTSSTTSKASQMDTPIPARQPLPRWQSRWFASNDDSSTSTEKENLTTSEVLSLDSIRSSLIRQEETIIFALIERAQYRHNAIVYQKGGIGHLGTPPGSKKIDDEELSFLEYMLTGTEALHYAVRRYTSPEEHAFFPHRLPSEKVLEDLEYPKDLLSSVGGASDVNFNPILLRKYVDVIVPAIAVPGDDEQHGSTVLADIAILQALSKRVHYGKFVAESKYLADPEGYKKLVRARDAKGVMKLLTNAEVEAKVLQRARLKAATYGQEPLLANSASKPAATSTKTPGVVVEDYVVEESQKKLCPGIVESVYRDFIIPLTKDVEMAYLFKRCGENPPPEYAPDRMSVDVTKLESRPSS